MVLSSRFNLFWGLFAFSKLGGVRLFAGIELPGVLFLVWVVCCSLGVCPHGNGLVVELCALGALCPCAPAFSLFQWDALFVLVLSALIPFPELFFLFPFPFPCQLSFQGYGLCSLLGSVGWFCDVLGKSCGKFLWENLVGNVCRKILREIFMGNSCGNLLWEIFWEI